MMHPQMREIHKVIFIRSMRMFMLVIPIMALYFQENGLSIRDIFVLQVIFSIAVVVFEIPSGYFADVFTRKTSIVISTIIAVAGYFAFFCANGFWGLALAEVILALSSGLMSGADSAFIYDSLVEMKKKDTYTWFEGRLVALAQVAEAVAALIGGFLVIFFSFKTLFLFQALLYIPVTLVALSLREPAAEVYETKRKNIVEIITFFLHENKKLRYLGLVTAVTTTATLAMVWFAQPYWKEIGIPLGYFGVLWAGLNLLVSLGAVSANWFEKRFSFRALFGWFVGLPVLLFFIMAYMSPHWIVLIPMALFWMIRGVKIPIMRDYVNRETRSDIRATVLSVNNMVARLMFAVLSPFFGWAADIWSFETAFVVSGVTLGILGAWFLWGLLGSMKERDDL